MLFFLPATKIIVEKNENYDQISKQPCIIFASIVECHLSEPICHFLYVIHVTSHAVITFLLSSVQILSSVLFLSVQITDIILYLLLLYSMLPWQPLFEPHFSEFRKWLPWQCTI